MSFIDQRGLDTVDALAAVVAGSQPSSLTFGAEDERFYLGADGAIAPPEITQAFLLERVRRGGVPVFDADSRDVLVKVVEERRCWSLEAAGVVELATPPYTLAELPRFAAELGASLAERDRGLSSRGHHPCPFSAPPALTTREAAARLVPTARMRALHRGFTARAHDHAALFTMFQEAVAQISVAPRSWQEASVLLRRAIQWAPLLYAATDNSCGYLRGLPAPHSLRSREWARHNAYGPAGKERAGAPGMLVDLAFGVGEGGFVERYLEHVSRVPMIYHWDEQGREVHGESRAFADLPAELRSRANASLALSLCWFDARLVTLPGDRLRVEVRSLDGGGSDSTWLGALLVCGALVDEQGGEEADALFIRSQVDRRGFQAARAALPELGLDTPFGRATLRDWLPQFCAIAGRVARRLGVAEEALTPLRELQHSRTSPNERHRRRHPGLDACLMACRAAS